MSRTRPVFSTIHTEGGVLPADLLARVAAGDKNLGGLTPEDYHLAAEERISEVASRAWSRLVGAWSSFRAQLGKLPEGDPATSLTRERWLLILFQELGYGRLSAAKAVETAGRSYPVSHQWGQIPIHLVGNRVDLDRRTAGVAGAARTSPHGLVQELLNQDDRYLWGFVSNGLQLRILRDNVSLTRQAYVEFDLEAMMEGQVYEDFVVLWMVCHESRVEGDKPEEFWLERWSRRAQEQGTRALDKLRDGVVEAIKILGKGFLSHPANQSLRDSLRTGSLPPMDYYRGLLRLVYRLIFLCVAEDRDVLLDPRSNEAARRRYLQYYSVGRLRHLAARRRGTPHGDLYFPLRLVMERLGRDEGCPDLALPALGGFLWTREAVPNLGEASISNRDLLDAVRALAFTAQGNLLRAVDFRNLGSEELGSVYESLLELHPELNTSTGDFELKSASGHERKTTGSYYTPESLVQCLLDSALEPVLDEASRRLDAEQAILGLKICDPACGSGHFLVAAAHRVAHRLARVRTGDEEPSPAAIRTALRDVVGHCLYAVDVNPMAVELCKVSLWMEAVEPGKPFPFLEHRILCGNSLLGTTPALMVDGIPDSAFEPIEGDEKAVCSSLRRQNKAEREGEGSLMPAMVAEYPQTYDVLSEGIEDLDAMPDDSMPGIHDKEQTYRNLVCSDEYEVARLAADAWCAAFVWMKNANARDKIPPITHDLFLKFEGEPGAVPVAVLGEVARLNEQYHFLHWHLAFPDVFPIPDDRNPDNQQTGWSGGFDVVLGNPPWERVKIQEKEWFAEYRPDIVMAPNAAARRKLIEALAADEPELYLAFKEDRRQTEGESHFLRNSGRYPLCGRGDVNTYTVFAETSRMLTGPTGRVGTIVPSGIATDDTTKYFFQDLMDSRALVSLYDFENRQGLFPAVDSRMKFCLLTLTGSAKPVSQGAEFAFFLHSVGRLKEPQRRFTLSAEDIALLNPNTRTCPVFRSRRDAEITKGIYNRVPVLIDETRTNGNQWNVAFLRMLDMANDSHLFRTRTQLEADGWALRGNVFERDEQRYLPLYEAKLIHHFDHRWATYDGTGTRNLTTAEKGDPSAVVMPRYWVPEEEVENRLERRDKDGNLIWRWDHDWLLGWRDITNVTNERTVIASVLPRLGVGHTCPLFVIESAEERALVLHLQANLSAFVLDFVARQKVGGTHLTYGYLNQLPVLPPSAYEGYCPWSRDETLYGWILARVLELTYTAWDVAPVALDVGFDGPPFIWSPERRALIRSELDAAFLVLYGVKQDDLAYIMDTFPIVKRHDEDAYGEYRTKRLVMESYGSMVRAMNSGLPYISVSQDGYRGT